MTTTRNKIRDAEALIRAMRQRQRVWPDISTRYISETMGLPERRVMRYMHQLLTDGQLEIRAAIEFDKLGLQTYIIYLSCASQRCIRRVFERAGGYKGFVSTYMFLDDKAQVVLKAKVRGPIKGFVEGLREHLGDDLAAIRVEKAATLLEHGSALPDPASMPAELDETDWMLLTELKRDATLTYAQLGDIVGLSGPSAFERVKRLKADGLLLGYMLHYAEKADRELSGSRVFFWMTVAASDIPRLTGYLKGYAHPDIRIKFAYQLPGRHNLLVCIYANHPRDIREFIEPLLSDFDIRQIAAPQLVDMEWRTHPRPA